MEVSEPYVSLSISEEGGRLGLKCLLLSYFRIGDYPTAKHNSESLLDLDGCRGLFPSVES
jgi:hypothetical protein